MRVADAPGLEADRAERLRLFDGVWSSHGSFLEAVLWRMTGDRERFAEAMQEALLLVWRHLDQLGGEGAGAYLYRIAQSAAGHAWRGRVAGAELPNQAGGEPVERRIERQERLDLVRRAICELPEQQGRAVTMRYLQQQDYPAIAREMGCSEATARSHVSKALASLKRILWRDVWKVLP